MPPAGSEHGAWVDDNDAGWDHYAQDYDSWGEEPWPGEAAAEGPPGWWSPAAGGPETTAESDLVGSAPPDVPGPMDAYHAAAGRRRSRRLITACLLVAIVIAAATLLTIRHRLAGSPAPSVSPTSVKEASGSGAPGGSTPLTDPSKLTVASVFPEGRLTADGLTFTVVASQVATSCALAAHGAFAAALTSAGCERVVRATFIDSSRKYVATAGVAVLPTSASARQADIKKQFGPDIWFTALNGAARTAAARVTRSSGYGYDAVDGRYIVFAFTAFSNGLSPTSPRADLPLLISLSKAFTDSAQQSLAAGAKQ